MRFSKTQNVPTRSGSLGFVIIPLLCLGIVGCHTTKNAKQTFSSFDLPRQHPSQDMLAAGSIYLERAPVADALKVYEGLSGRTVIQAQIPPATITVHTPRPLNRIQALQLLDTVLAQNGIAMVLAGENAVKAMPVVMAIYESAPEITLPWNLLPDSSSFMVRKVRLQKLRAEKALQQLNPLGGFGSGAIVIVDTNLLILRGYSSNVRQQLKLLEELDGTATNATTGVGLHRNRAK